MKIPKILFLSLLIVSMLLSIISCGPAPQETPGVDTPGGIPDDQPGENEGGDPEPEPDPEPVEFERTAFEYMNDMSIGINVGNSLESYYQKTFGSGSLSDENLWKNPAIGAYYFRYIKRLGFDTVRIPVTWFGHMDPETLTIDSDWMTRVYRVVKAATDNDMKVILNVHHDTYSGLWLTLDPDKYEETSHIFEILWTQIANKFNEFGENVLFEGFNEACGSVEGANYNSKATQKVLDDLNQLFVNTVRSTGGNNEKRYLICSTYFTRSTAMILSSFQMPEDPLNEDNRIIVQTHVYATSKAGLEQNFTRLYDMFVSKGIPVIIGECGMKTDDASITLETRVKYGTNLASIANKCGVRLVLWDTGDGGNYQLINRKNASIRTSETVELMSCVRQPEFIEAVMDEITNRKPLSSIPKKTATVVSDNLLTSGWNGHAPSSSGNSVTKGSTFTANIENPGSVLWSAQAYITGLSFEKGKSYRITFNYSCNSGFNFPVMLQRNANSTLIDGVILGDATSETFTMDFTVDDTSWSSLQIMIYCGGPSMEEPYQLTITDVGIYEIQYN